MLPNGNLRAASSDIEELYHQQNILTVYRIETYNFDPTFLGQLEIIPSIVYETTRKGRLMVTKLPLSIEKEGRHKTHLGHITIEKLVLPINQQMLEIRIAERMNGSVLIKLVVI